LVGFRDTNGRLAVVCGRYLVAPALEHGGHSKRSIAVIVDDKYSMFGDDSPGCGRVSIPDKLFAGGKQR
jgi:hypothetical protein